MKYTKDSRHDPILGKAGDFVDVLSRVPADTDIILKNHLFLSDRFQAEALDISLADYQPFEHVITPKNDGTLENTLTVNISVNWNRDKNLGEAEIFTALFRALEHIFRKRGGGHYDSRKLPKPESIAKTAANNPFTFLDVLNDFQKTYKNKKEKK